LDEPPWGEEREEKHDEDREYSHGARDWVHDADSAYGQRMSEKKVRKPAHRLLADEKDEEKKKSR
jgi:hypothetical protein